MRKRMLPRRLFRDVVQSGDSGTPGARTLLKDFGHVGHTIGTHIGTDMRLAHRRLRKVASRLVGAAPS